MFDNIYRDPKQVFAIATFEKLTHFLFIKILSPNEIEQYQMQSFISILYLILSHTNNTKNNQFQPIVLYEWKTKKVTLLEPL